MHVIKLLSANTDNTTHTLLTTVTKTTRTYSPNFFITWPYNLKTFVLQNIHTICGVILEVCKLTTFSAGEIYDVASYHTITSKGYEYISTGIVWNSMC